MEILTNAYKNQDELKMGKCNLAFTPILSSANEVKKDISSSDLYKLGLLSNDLSFLKEVIPHVTQRTYLDCLKNCDFDVVRRALNGGSDWFYSLSRIEEVQVRGIFSNGISDVFGEMRTIEELANFYLNFKSPYAGLPSDYYEKLNTSIEEIINNKYKEKTKAPKITNDLQFYALAMDYLPFQASQLVSALRKITTFMESSSYSNNIVSGTGLLKKILTDKYYWEASHLTAKKIINRLNKTDTSTSNIFNDYLDSFKSLGLSHEVATNKTFAILGLYATRGSNLGTTVELFLPKGEVRDTFVRDLNVITNGISILNTRLFPEHKNYAFPGNVHVSFDNAKPYHFWLPAYLTRMLINVGISPKVAKTASYIASMGYQMKSETFGRDPAKAFTVDTFSPHNNKIRMDLVYAAAGASFGADTNEVNATKIYDLDLAFIKLVEKTTPYEPLSEEKAKKLWQGTGAAGYLRWKKIFNPDILLDQFR